jgi:hypothetical protein
VFSVAWNGSLWVAGGNDASNRLAFSPDGINWTTSTSGNALITEYCWTVGWNGSLWVAGGSGTNQLVYSSDGIAWSVSASGNAVFTSNCLAVAWNGSLWVAGGSGTNQLAYSTNGIAWIGSSSGNAVFTTTCTSVAWTGTRWVAGGTGTNSLAYSDDGITWTASATGTSLFASGCQGLASNGFITVAVGQGTTFTTAYTDDGITWYGGGTIFSGGSGRSIAWNGRLWIAGGVSAAVNSMGYSYNGVTWTGTAASVFSTGCFALSARRVLPYVGYNFSESAKSGSKVFMVAVGEGTNQIVNSYDGLRWNPSTSANALMTTNGATVAYNGRMWLAGGTGGFSLIYSYDGINWSPSPGGSVFFAGAGGTTKLATNGTIWLGHGYGSDGNPVSGYSYDGFTWTAHAARVFSFAWNGSYWIAANVTSSLVTSAGGVSWTAATAPYFVAADALQLAAAWNGSLWVAGGIVETGQGSMAYSRNGQNWFATKNDIFTDGTSSSKCGAVAWNGSLWVAGGAGTASLGYSYDGLTWYKATSPFSTACTSVVWNGSLWIATGDAKIVYSIDGITWSTSATGTTVLTTAATAVAVASLNQLPSVGGAPVPAETFVVVGGQNGADILAYSYDGVIFSGLGNTLFTRCNSVAWNGRTWVAGGFTSAGSGECVIAYSYDGFTWVKSTSGSAIFSAECYGVAWTGKLWVAGGSNTTSPSIAYSSDGITWALASSSTAVFTNCRALASNGYITVAGGQAKVGYSYDGINWVEAPTGSAIFTGECRCIAYNGILWVAGGDYNLAYSYDGINWTTSATGSTLMAHTCNSVAWNGTRWVAVGASANGTGSVAYSSDGIAWTDSASGTAIFTINALSIGWNGTWIASGYNGTIELLAYSPDGITWTATGATSYSGARSITSRRVLPYYGTAIGGPAGAIKLSQYGTGTSDVSAFTLAVTFTTPFPVTPSITATVTDASASWASIGSASGTGFTAYTWNAAGGVQAALNWMAIL